MITVLLTPTEGKITKCGDALWLENKDVAVTLLRPLERLRNIVMSTSVCVCLCVCLSTRIFSEPQVRCLPKFSWMLPMAVARFSSGVVAMRYVLPVLWMTSGFFYSEPYNERYEFCYEGLIFINLLL